MVYKFFDKKSLGGAVTHADKSAIKTENFSNQESAEKLHKPIIRKYEKGKVHSYFIDNICGANFADMQLIIKFNKEIRFLFCFSDIFSKYAWVVPLKDKKDTKITKAFQEILNKSSHKPNEIWVDEGRN